MLYVKNIKTPFWWWLNFKFMLLIQKIHLLLNKTKNPLMENIIKCISKGIEDKIQLLIDFNVDELNLPNYN